MPNSENFREQGESLEVNVKIRYSHPGAPATLYPLPDQRARLGLSTWLKTAEFERNADEVIFSGGLTRLGALPG